MSAALGLCCRRYLTFHHRDRAPEAPSRRSLTRSDSGEARRVWAGGVVRGRVNFRGRFVRVNWSCSSRDRPRSRGSSRVHRPGPARCARAIPLSSCPFRGVPRHEQAPMVRARTAPSGPDAGQDIWAGYDAGSTRRVEQLSRSGATHLHVSRTGQSPCRRRPGSRIYRNDQVDPFACRGRGRASARPRREVIPNLVKTLPRCHSTVRGLR